MRFQSSGTIKNIPSVVFLVILNKLIHLYRLDAEQIDLFVDHVELHYETVLISCLFIVI